jgi:hypothetical protein
MPESGADVHAAQVSGMRARKLRLLRSEGLRPNTPPAVLEQMLEAIDVTDLAGSLATVKSRWGDWFGTPRSADRIAARALDQ